MKFKILPEFTKMPGPLAGLMGGPGETIGTDVSVTLYLLVVLEFESLRH